MARVYRIGRQLIEIRRLAAEGLSQTRTAKVMGLTRGQIAGAAKYYKIRFKCREYAPVTHRPRRYATNAEELRIYNREAKRRSRLAERGQNV
jgi:hypothetical protein